MKICPQCEQANPDEASYCLRCGTKFEAVPEHVPEPEVRDEEEVWRMFVGSSQTLTFSLKDGWKWDSAANYYLAQFRKFQVGATPRYTLTWHWPAFLIDPFFWFLYRKMYLYAVVYLVGPVIAFFLTGDITVGFIWRVIAGGSANYLYFWHVREHLNSLREQVGPLRPIPDPILRDAGGVQPYVFVLGILLHLFVLFAIMQGPPNQAMLQDGGGTPGEEPHVF